LSRYREAARTGASAEELASIGAGLDPDLLATVRWSQTSARAARPQPDPVFADRLRRELVQAANANAPAQPTPHAVRPRPIGIAEGDADGRALPPAHASAARAAPRPRELPPRRWGYLAAVAALVLLALGGVLLALRLGIGRPTTEIASPGAPSVETMLDTAIAGAPDSWLPLTIERWSFQPGGTLSIPAVDGPQWLTAETGSIVATIDGASQTLAAGRSVVVPAGQTVAFRNTGLGEVAALRGVASLGFALADYDPALVQKAAAFHTAASMALPPGSSRLVFDQLTIPPDMTMLAEAATGQDWFAIGRGHLGLTLVGDALPAGWSSGHERTLTPADTIPVLVPGTQLTMHNLGDEPLVLLRLRVQTTPGAAAVGG
ncbi:MAG TPA: hypothetical protein VFQ80_02745, partial [Thermomicrobiales bacterium]|nr:hypothetical protein [Thermomicrobiales bacterium]